MENHYKTLGLKRGASLKEISAAYRSLALIHHPDKRKSSHTNSTSDEIFFKIKAAYQALQDPKTRAELDLQLLGQEERAKRDEQMSQQRKQMRDELLSREKAASGHKEARTGDSTHPTTATNCANAYKLNLTNEDACLKLRYKSTLNNPDLASEMIRSTLLPFNLLNLHPEKNGAFVAEFRDPQSAYKALISVGSSDLVSKAEWYKGYPPENLNIVIGKSSSTSASVNVNVNNANTANNTKMKYSKDLEMSVLERLRQKKKKKLEGDQQQQEG